MGQYANSPDFATKATEITKSDTINADKKLNSAALYVGTGGDLKVIIAGTVKAGGGFPEASQAVTFKNIPDGSFTPVIVDYVLSTGTSAGDLVAVY